MNMTLVHSDTKEPVAAGDIVCDFRGRKEVVDESIGQSPVTIAPTGRIHIATSYGVRQHHPVVYNCEWVDL